MILRILFLAAVILEMALLPISSLAAPPRSPQFLPGFPSIAGEKVLLFWSPIPGAVSYKILVDGKLLAVTADAWHTAPLPESGEDVRFQVSAVSGTGEESEPGAPRILRLRKIEAPKDLQGATSPDPPSVVLAWKAVRGAVGNKVYRSGSGGGSSPHGLGGSPRVRERSVDKASR